jgi:SnoaL-like polyketide cyclase
MDQNEMTAMLDRHLTAGDDIEDAMAVYGDDVVHDAVGFPGSPRIGKEAARDFYRFLIANFRREGGRPINRFFDGDTMILEEEVTGSVIGEIVGIAGNGRSVTFRILHVVGFREGLIRREQIWTDGGAIVAQLTAS